MEQLTLSERIEKIEALIEASKAMNERGKCYTKKEIEYYIHGAREYIDGEWITSKEDADLIRSKHRLETQEDRRYVKDFNKFKEEIVNIARAFKDKELDIYAKYVKEFNEDRINRGFLWNKMSQMERKDLILELRDACKNVYNHNDVIERFICRGQWRQSSKPVNLWDTAFNCIAQNKPFKKELILDSHIQTAYLRKFIEKNKDEMMEMYREDLIQREHKEKLYAIDLKQPAQRTSGRRVLNQEPQEPESQPTKDRWSKAPSKQEPEEDEAPENKRTNRFKR